MALKINNAVNANAENKTAKTAERAAANAKAQAGAKATTPVEPDVKDDELESMCDTLIFVAPLEDPSNPDKTPIKGKDGTIENITTGRIVGYKFKSTKAITIPDCGLDAGFKKDRMNYVNKTGTRQVKAGEEFDLTPFEMAMLLSLPQYNSKATGGDYHVKCKYSFPGAEKKDGKVVRVQEGKTPNVSLNGLNCTIKKLPMIPVLTFETHKNSNGSTVKPRTIIAGYEKWQPLCEGGVRKGGSAGERASTKVYNDQAQAFLNIINKRA